ncbi:MAG: DUF2807 domain-containing protein [Bacteroidota bacterium]
MKTSNKILAISFFLLFIIAISTMAFIRANSEAQAPIEATGKRTARTENINFKKLEMLDISVGNVTLVQGEPKVEITCAENIHEFLNKSYDHSKGLYEIGLKSGSFNNLDVAIKISANNLKNIVTSRNAYLSSEAVLDFDNINLTTSGGASIDIELNANQLTVRSSDGSRVTLGGKVKEVLATASNAGAIYARDLSSETLDAQISDAGRLSIRVEEELSATVSNAGVLKYMGHPEIKRQKITDAGRLTKLDDVNE